MKIKTLAESAIMIALATLLSVFTVYKLPFGGSVTLFSQLPIIIIAYRYGTKQGLFTGLVMGVLQLLLGAENLSYVTGLLAVLILVFADYIVAFGVLGLSGIFRKRFKNPALELSLGAAVTSFIRYICHIISGATIWKGYAPESTSALSYSIKYNASYMIPELIVTVIGAAVIAFSFDLLSPEIKVRKRNKK